MLPPDETSNPGLSEDDTREKLVAAATQQFAERGFFGASISQIAGEVGLTKQALLYHFKRKDDLYSEVIKRIAQRLQTAMDGNLDPSQPPHKQFEDMLMGFYEVAKAHPVDARLLMREMLDDKRKDAPESQWYLRNTLNRIFAMLSAIPGMERLTFEQKFARIYTVVSAIEYFAGSQVPLRRFYGQEGLAAIAKAYPAELRRQIRAITHDGDSEPGQ